MTAVIVSIAVLLLWNLFLTYAYATAMRQISWQYDRIDSLRKMYAERDAQMSSRSSEFERWLFRGGRVPQHLSGGAP